MEKEDVGTQRAFTLLELLVTVGVAATLLVVIGHVLRRDVARRQLAGALAVMENLLSLAATTARLDRICVRVLWDLGDEASGRRPQVFLLSSPQEETLAEGTLLRSRCLPEHTCLLTRIGTTDLPAGEVVELAEDWLTGVTTTLSFGPVPVRAWCFDPSGELREADGASPDHRAMGVGLGKNLSPVGCVWVNTNGHIRSYEGIDAVQDVLAAQ